MPQNVMTAVQEAIVIAFVDNSRFQMGHRNLTVVLAMVVLQVATSNKLRIAKMPKWNNRIVYPR